MNGSTEQQQQQGEGDAGSDAAHRNLPPALRARLIKRGIIKDAGGGDAAPAVAAGDDGSAAAAADGAPPAAAAAGVPAGVRVLGPLPDLPVGWLAAVDGTYSATYYYNPATGERSWTKPCPGLPEGWVDAADPATGTRYYCNAKLGLSQWHHPLQQPPPVAAAAPAPAAAAAAGGLFIAAASFTGARPGYVFKSGSKGLGYYQDFTPAGLAPAAAAAAAGVGVAAAATAAAGPTVAAGVVAGPAVYSSSAVSRTQEDRGPKKTKLEKIAEMQAARNAALSKSGRGRAKQGGDELDPMDPASYSDAPRGGWGTGIDTAAPLS